MPEFCQLPLDRDLFPVSPAKQVGFPRRSGTHTPAQRVREVLKPYLDLPLLRTLAAGGGDVIGAMRALGDEPVPPEVLALLNLYAVMLRPATREQITSPADLAALLMAQMGLLEQEELWLVSLTTKNHVIAIDTIYRGTIDSSTIRSAEIFKTALRRNAASVIVAHNHPSGDVTPSPEDVAVTRDIAEGGKLLGCTLRDHLIIGHGRWVSLRERRLGFAT